MTTQITSVNSTTSKFQIGGVDAFSFTTAAVTVPSLVSGAGAFTTLSASGNTTSGSGATGAVLIPASPMGNAAIYNASLTPSSSNYGIGFAVASTYLNGSTSVVNQVNGVTVTTTSSTGLAVTGALSATTTLGLTTSGANADLLLTDSGTTAGNVRVRGVSNAMQLITNGGVSATLDTSGNLGLGVTPSAWNVNSKALQIGASRSGSLMAENGYYGETALSTNAYLQTGSYGWKYNSSNAAVYYSQNGPAGAGTHAWYTAPSGTAGNAITWTQAMTLDASGNLLVGTTSSAIGQNGGWISPSFTRTGSAGMYLAHQNGASSGDVYVGFGYNAGLIGSITQSGTTAVLYNTTSDYRLKDVIGPVSGSGARLDALNPIEYTWKADGQHTRGFLAHEFQSVYAQSVNGTKDEVDENGNPKYQSMQAGSAEVIADLVAEIKSLRTRLAAAGIA